ncbi:hypothetical protein DFH09DRAFT_1503276 [Mycena vulgaris]|nr:hypothetical protein DFH09DRAFT_1503276 [Mycena vulgaris]
MRSLLLCRLYRCAYLASWERCSSVLPMLLQRPDSCQHLRELTSQEDASANETWLADRVADIVPTLSLPRTFEWDGGENASDRMWMSLRQSCPGLKQIRCTAKFPPHIRPSIVASHLPPIQLLKFSNLTSFSLGLRHNGNFYWAQTENLRAELWDMLRKCPDLEELSLDSFGWDRGYFQRARLRRLRSLSGDPGTTPLFPLAALPALTLFRGRPRHLDHVPYPEGVQTLGITSTLFRAELPRALPMLARFTALIRLDLRLGYRPPSASLHGLFHACPRLVALDIKYAMYVDISMNAVASLATALRRLRDLRTFSLTKTYTFKESTAAAARILLRGVPALTYVTVRWMHAKMGNPLKEAGTYEVVGGNVVAWERGQDLFGEAYTRRYRGALDDAFSVEEGEDEEDSSSDGPEPDVGSEPDLLPPDTSRALRARNHARAAEHVFASSGSPPWDWVIFFSDCACSSQALRFMFMGSNATLLQAARGSSEVSSAQLGRHSVEQGPAAPGRISAKRCPVYRVILRPPPRLGMYLATFGMLRARGKCLTHDAVWRRSVEFQIMRPSVPDEISFVRLLKAVLGE